MSGERILRQQHPDLCLFDRPPPPAGADHDCRRRVTARVLNEFTNVLRRKQKQDWAVIEAAVQSVRFRFSNIVPLTADTHAAALALARDHALAFYDALIVAAAIEAGCDTLYSEDLQHGRSIGRLAIVNPFAGSVP
jgi:predicted nucleic acid-binding protein